MVYKCQYSIANPEHSHSFVRSSNVKLLNLSQLKTEFSGNSIHIVRCMICSKGTMWLMSIWPAINRFCACKSWGYKLELCLSFQLYRIYTLLKMNQVEPSFLCGWFCFERLELRALMVVESRMHFTRFIMLQLIIIGVSDLLRIILNNLIYSCYDLIYDSNRLNETTKDYNTVIEFCFYNLQIKKMVSHFIFCSMIVIHICNNGIGYIDYSINYINNQKERI